MGKKDRMGIITTLFYRWGVVEEGVYNWKPGKTLRWGGEVQQFLSFAYSILIFYKENVMKYYYLHNNDEY